MISARGPTPRRQTSLASMSGHPCFASLARLPDRSTPCRPARRRRATALLASRPIPSGIGMTKPTIQQARDRAEVLWGTTRPERATSAGSPGTSVNGLPKRARECLAQGHECGSRARSSNLGNGSISAVRMPMIGWLLLALLGRSDQARTCPLIAGLCCKVTKCRATNFPLKDETSGNRRSM